MVRRIITIVAPLAVTLYAVLMYLGLPDYRRTTTVLILIVVAATVGLASVAWAVLAPYRPIWRQERYVQRELADIRDEIMLGDERAKMQIAKARRELDVKFAIDQREDLLARQSRVAHQVNEQIIAVQMSVISEALAKWRAAALEGQPPNGEAWQEVRSDVTAMSEILGGLAVAPGGELN